MKNLLLIAIGLFAGIGGMLSFKGCRSGPSPETISTTRRADSAQHALDSTKGADMQVIARLQVDTAHKNRLIDTLQQQRIILQKDLAQRAKQVQQTLSDGDAAAGRRDTAAIVINWDSLRAQVRAGLPVVIANDRLGDEQIQAFMANAKVRDSLETYWEHLFHTADTANALQKKAFTSLQKDFDKKQFQLKIWKPVAIGGLAYVAISIFMNSIKK